MELLRDGLAGACVFLSLRFRSHVDTMIRWKGEREREREIDDDEDDVVWLVVWFSMVAYGE